MLKGYICILISALLFGSYGIWSKLTQNHFENFILSSLRTLLVSVIALLILVKSKKSIKIYKDDIKWFLLIGLFGGLSLAPYNFTFKYLEIGTATFLFYFSLTLGGFLFGRLIFKEKISKIKFLSLILGLIGLLIIFDLNFDRSLILSILAGIISGLLASLEIVLSKKISNNYSIQQIIFYTFILMSLINLIFSFLFKENMPKFNFDIEWIYLIIYSLATYFAFQFVLLGYKYLDASTASIVGLTEIIFGVLFGIIFFDEIIQGKQIFGWIIIIFSIFLPYIKFNKK